MLRPILPLTHRTTVPDLPTLLAQHQLRRLPTPLCLITPPRVTQHSLLETFALALLPNKTHTRHVRRKRHEFRREIKLFLISDHAATFIQAVRFLDIDKGAIWRRAAWA